jgi:hypothetical protein
MKWVIHHAMNLVVLCSKNEFGGNSSSFVYCIYVVMYSSLLFLDYFRVTLMLANSMVRVYHLVVLHLFH